MNMWTFWRQVRALWRWPPRFRVRLSSALASVACMSRSLNIHTLVAIYTETVNIFIAPSVGVCCFRPRAADGVEPLSWEECTCQALMFWFTCCVHVHPEVPQRHVATPTLVKCYLAIKSRSSQSNCSLFAMLLWRCSIKFNFYYWF